MGNPCLGVRPAQGAIDTATTRDFDAACVSVPASLEARGVKLLRESQNVSQPVSARYLSTSGSAVETWGTEAKRPSDLALKLLAIVRKHGLQVLA